MSRADKRVHQERVVGTERDESVRLFAFANTRPGYQVCFSPERPLVILKTKKPAVEQHPCKQWEPLSTLVFGAQPNSTHAVYVADTTALCGPQHEQEEIVNGAAVGPLLKRLSNVITKLNPHNATLVAAGVSGFLAFKYMLVGEKQLGHPDRLLHHLLLVCPASIAPFQQLVAAALRKPAPATPYPAFDITVLLNDPAQEGAWDSWLRSLHSNHPHLIGEVRVTTNVSPSLFAAIVREAGVTADGTTVDTRKRFATPQVFRIDFVLSKQTKSVEQIPRLSPLDTLGFDDTTATHDGHHNTQEESEVEEEEELKSHGEQDAAAHGHAHDHDDQCGSCCDTCEGEGDEEGGSSMLVSGITTLQHWKEPVRVMVEGRVLDLASGLVGTTEGLVVVDNLRSCVEADAAVVAHVAKRKAAAVALATSIRRTPEGRTTLHALEIRALTKREEARSMTAGSGAEEHPAYNVSTVQHSCAALLVRGRKCALVRDVSGDNEFEGMRLPQLPLAEADETSMECATRALCTYCDVSSDNFYQPSYLPPTVYYVTEENGAVRCVTVYLMVAVAPPPRGPASDAVEDAPEPEEPYDWVSYARALSLLATEAEQDAVKDLEKHLRRAFTVGLYKPPAGCGVFGDAVGDAKASRADGKKKKAAANALRGMNLLVITAPGDAANELVESVQGALRQPNVFLFDGAATSAQLEQAAVKAVEEGRTSLVVYVANGVDLDAFCEAQLLHLRDDCGAASARIVTVLLPHVVRALTDLDSEDGVNAEADEERRTLMEALLAAARLSDVLLTLDPPSCLTSAGWAMLHVCALANSELDFCSGLEAQRPFSLSEEPADSLSDRVAKDAPGLQRIELVSPKGVPMAPAALAYLAQPGRLACFDAPRAAVTLLYLQGEVWVASRPQAQGFVCLDPLLRCLVVDEGEPWTAAGTVEASRGSSLSLLLWARPSVAEAVSTMAQTMLSQLLWSNERDGEDWAKAKDPLPAWDE